VRSAPPGRFQFLVLLFRGGELDGAPQPEPRSELDWADPRQIDPHPSLAVALADLGMIERERADLFRDLARIGVEMRRVL
jgi:hypothetical protein